MCGIVAVYLHQEEKNIEAVKNAYDMITNRGPDSGTWLVEKDRIIGFRRLAIMDTSDKGTQPFNVNGDSLVCNGEIYNHKELMSKYDLPCESASDCECIIHLYHKIGFEKMIKELIGDFAIVLFTENKLLFARDRIGVRPLFYGFTKDGNFAVASFARALAEYCDKINPLLPGWGEYEYETKEVTFFKYDPPRPRAFVPNVEELIKTTLITSVKDRLMSERPIGCLLSGGLDSSLITSILCNLLGSENVRTYSIGMTGSEDLKQAQKVATYLGTKHTEVLFTPEEGFNAIPDVIRDLESYDITTIRASVGMWLLAKYISEKSDDIVLYSGEGADELFCGYLYFHYAPTSYELGEESRRLIKELYLYDVLRADRCISSHGLELRVPFLDPRLTELCQSLESNMIKPFNGIEKYLLRSAFDNEEYLPDSILWRRKDGMSDGISGDSGKKWFEQIQEFVELKISDEEYEPFKTLFPSKESYYYKKLFDELFPTYQPVFKYWLPKWIDCKGDPSGRLLTVFENTSYNTSIKMKEQLKGYLSERSINELYDLYELKNSGEEIEIIVEQLSDEDDVVEHEEVVHEEVVHEEVVYEEEVVQHEEVIVHEEDVVEQDEVVHEEEVLQHEEVIVHEEEVVVQQDEVVHEEEVVVQQDEEVIVHEEEVVVQQDEVVHEEKVVVQQHEEVVHEEDVLQQDEVVHEDGLEYEDVVDSNIIGEFSGMKISETHTEDGCVISEGRMDNSCFIS